MGARRPLSAETRAKIAAAMKGNMNGKGSVRSPECRARIAEKMRGNKHTLGRKESIEAKVKRMAALKAPDVEARRREGLRKAWQDPATRARYWAVVAKRRGLPVLPSPLQGIMGIVPLYRSERVVFFRPEA